MSLTSWFDASTLTQIDGTVLTDWDDKSALDNHAVSSSPAAPTVRTNVQNGLRGVLFDGVDDWIHWHPANSNQMSRFIVFKWNGATPGGGNAPRLWEGYDYSLCIHPTNRCLMLKYWRATTTGDVRTANDSILPGNVYLAEVYNDRSSEANVPGIYINGVQQVTSVIAVASGALTNNTFMALGNAVSAVNGQKAFSGYIFEARFFDNILISSDAATNRSQMLNTWGIGGAVRAKITAGAEPMVGSLPILVLSKDTVHGKIATSGAVSAIRHTAGPVKKQTLLAAEALAGAITHKFVRRKISGSLGMAGTASAQLTTITRASLARELSLSGTLTATIAAKKEHHCKECFKRWAHRWFSRSD